MSTQPTGPGWWWRQGNHGPYIDQVDGDQNHALFVSLSGADVTDDGTWLAEVPTPEVLTYLRACERLALAADEYDAVALEDNNRAEWAGYIMALEDFRSARKVAE